MPLSLPSTKPICTAGIYAGAAAAGLAMVVCASSTINNRRSGKSAEAVSDERGEKAVRIQANGIKGRGRNAKEGGKAGALELEGKEEDVIGDTAEDARAVRAYEEALLGEENGSVWLRVQMSCASTAVEEPGLEPMLRRAVLSHASLEASLAHVLAHRLASAEFPAEMWHRAIGEVLFPTRVGAAAWPLSEGAHPLPALAREDLRCVHERDPACLDEAHALLHFKGFQCLQAHRVAHVLWHHFARRRLAVAFQSRCSEVFGMDLHPAATIGMGVMFDHGTGIVVGETARIGDGCTLLHGVTLGGSGKETGAQRHPVLKNNVLVGAHASILGRQEIQDGAKIGCGSVVLSGIPAGATAVGVPAKIVGRSRDKNPGHEVDYALKNVETRHGQRSRSSSIGGGGEASSRDAGAAAGTAAAASAASAKLWGEQADFLQRAGTVLSHRRGGGGGGGLYERRNAGSLKMHKVGVGKAAAAGQSDSEADDAEKLLLRRSTRDRNNGMDSGVVRPHIAAIFNNATTGHKPSTSPHPHVDSIFPNRESFSGSLDANVESRPAARGGGRDGNRTAGNGGITTSVNVSPTTKASGPNSTRKNGFDTPEVQHPPSAKDHMLMFGEEEEEGSRQDGGNRYGAEYPSAFEQHDEPTWRSIWRHLDLASDGLLVARQFHERLEGRGLTHAEIDELFFQLDSDCDGMVSEEEFMRASTFIFADSSFASSGCSTDASPARLPCIVSVGSITESLNGLETSMSGNSLSDLSTKDASPQRGLQSDVCLGIRKVMSEKSLNALHALLEDDGNT